METSLMSESVVDAADVEETVTQEHTWRFNWDMSKDP
jgi:hypothetical protein